MGPLISDIMWLVCLFLIYFSITQFFLNQCLCQIFHLSLLICISPAMKEHSSFSLPLQTLVVHYNFIRSYSNGYEMTFHLMCFSLKVSNIQHLCSFYSQTLISLLRNICSYAFSILKSNCYLTN